MATPAERLQERNNPRSISSFASQVLSGAGLSRTNRFEIDIPPPPALQNSGDVAGLASLYIEQASFPPLSVFVKPYKIFGPSYQRPITSEYGGEGIPITFHVDRDMRIKSFFENWMHKVIDPVTFTVGYQADYSSDITIKQLNEKHEQTYGVVLRSAFPRNMNLMELNNASTNQTHRLTITFAYHYWKPLTDAAQEQIVDIPRPLIRPEVPTIDTRINTPNTNTGRQWNWQTGSLEDSPGSDLPPSA